LKVDPLSLCPDGLSELVIVGERKSMGVKGTSTGLRVSCWVEKWSPFHALIMVGSVAFFNERTRRQIITGIIIFVIAGNRRRIRESPILEV